MEVARIKSGSLFLRFDAHDRILTGSSKSMTSVSFLENFRCNLLEIGVDPFPYGTHSFRRGGCQYLSSEKRWGIRKLCDWGGWSMAFGPDMITRYLYNWNDNPVAKREDFMNPGTQRGSLCTICGRSCSCA